MKIEHYCTAVWVMRGVGGELRYVFVRCCAETDMGKTHAQRTRCVNKTYFDAVTPRTEGMGI